MAHDTLQGYRTLVTGASSGIGRGVAVAFAAAGARVAVNYVGNPDGAQETLRMLQAAGGSGIVVQADVSDPDAVSKMTATVIEEFGGLDTLVANAGVQKDAPVLDLAVEDWRRVIDVNLTGQFLCAQAAARQFVVQGPDGGPGRSAGTILCMSSVHDVIPWAGHVNYAASKGGIELLMRTLAQELAPHRVRVNAISPGAIKTEINRDAWQTADAERELLTLIPYGRVGEADDIARAAVWLASDDADYVTGATLYVDGGMTLYPGFRGNG